MRPRGEWIRGGLVGLPPIMRLYTIVPLFESTGGAPTDSP